MSFEKAFRSTSKVQGYTHDFYKYPARFSPTFVRFIIESLTEPGDHVLDPFMGGGTTIVEATASGRYATGSDINALGRFAAAVKTTPLSDQDVAAIRDWVTDVRATVTDARQSTQFTATPIRNLPVITYRFFDTATRLAARLQFPRRRQFARCAIARVGQWALDGRSSIPGTVALVDNLEGRVEKMLSGLSEFVCAAKQNGILKNKITATRRILPHSATDRRLAVVIQEQPKQPRLVLTSPPYPGVHVLYHRWQVLGRRETPAPYWIANLRDGHGASYYTMGSRSVLGLKAYFRKLSAAFHNLRQIVAPDAVIVQLVAFSDAAVQLPHYLEVMVDAGFREAQTTGIHSRQIRTVPNRKWYNGHRARNDASQEILLLHRPE